jgi:hypothetical protein
VGYVLFLKPSHDWWHPEGSIGSLKEAAQAAGWRDAEHPGAWVKVVRTFRDSSQADWWVLEVVAGPYGPSKPHRAVIATTDPVALPKPSTMYLITNLPHPEHAEGHGSGLAPATLEELVWLYGLRMWIEQSYKQVKHVALLVGVPGAERPCHPPALAVGLLRLYVLLAPPTRRRPSASRHGSARAAAPGSHSSRKKSPPREQSVRR